MTLGGYLEEWLLQSVKGRVSDRTLAGYRGNVERYLLPKLGTIALEKLAPRHIQKMESELLRFGGETGKPLSPTTVLHVHRVLSKALNDAVKLCIVARNVVAAVQPPRVTQGLLIVGQQADEG